MGRTMTGFRIRLTNVRIKDNKIERVHKLAAGQRKNKAAKAARQARDWKKRSKP